MEEWCPYSSRQQFGVYLPASWHREGVATRFTLGYFRQFLDFSWISGCIEIAMKHCWQVDGQREVILTGDYLILCTWRFLEELPAKINWKNRFPEERLLLTELDFSPWSTQWLETKCPCANMVCVLLSHIQTGPAQLHFFQYSCNTPCPPVPSPLLPLTALPSILWSYRFWSQAIKAVQTLNMAD